MNDFEGYKIVGAGKTDSSSEIDNFLEFSRTRVCGVFKKLHLRTKTSRKKWNGGRKWLMNNRSDRWLTQIVYSNRRVTTQQIVA